MASVQRIVHPVYSHLDNENPTRALKECDQILKKHSKKGAISQTGELWQTTLVLKAIAFQRLNRADEAVECADQVAALKPTDETILQMLSNVYRDLDIPEKMPGIYEEALKHFESEELFTHTFMAHLRSDDFMKMKLLGGKLFQKYKKYPYLYWSAMAGYLQAIRSDDDRMKKMNLTIARRTIEKDLDKIENERQIKLYLMIIDAMGDTEAMARALENHEKLFTETLYSRKYRLLELWEKTNQFDNVVTEVLSQLDEDDNDIGAWRKLVKTVLSKNCQKSKIRTADDLIQFISEKSISSRSRAPDLAKFELVLEISGVPENWGSLKELIKNYCLKWKTKSSTVFDIEYISEKLSDDDKLSIVKSLLDNATEADILESANLDAICAAHLLPYQLALQWNISEFLDESPVLSFATKIIAKASSFPSVLKLMDTEGRPWDRHYLIAAYIVLRRDLSEKNIIQALQILEDGSRASGTCPDLLLLSLNLYARLECITSVLKLFITRLDLKSIQSDSIGYVLYPLVFHLHPDAAVDVVESPLIFYKNSNKDTTEAIIKCYREGNFEQVEDMMDFREAVAGSIMRRLISVEAQIITSCFGSRLPLKAQHGLTDNRDFDALNWWCPNRRERLGELKKTSFDEHMSWVNFREEQLKIIEGNDDFTVISKLIDECNPTELSEEIVICGYHSSPTRDVRNLIVSLLKLLTNLKKTIINDEGQMSDEVSNFKSSMEAVCAGSLRERWFVIECIMSINNFVKKEETKLQEIKKKGKKTSKRAKDSLNSLIELGKFLQDSEKIFIGVMPEFESLSLGESVDVATCVKEERLKLRKTQNDLFVKYGSNLLRLLQRK